MRVPYINDYERIAREIASGPNFGIHGTKYSKLEGILSSKGWMKGHYLAVDDEAKKNNPPKLFYEKLCASIQEVLGFSTHPKYQEGIITTESLPLIILGIEKKGTSKGAGICLEHKGDYGGISSGLADKKGLPISTFGVGEGFIRSLVDIVPLIIDSTEIEDINDKFRGYLSRLSKTGKPIMGEGMVASEFFTGECIERYISKIRKEVYLKDKIAEYSRQQLLENQPGNQKA
jgi:hypothetical protein